MSSYRSRCTLLLLTSMVRAPVTWVRIIKTPVAPVITSRVSYAWTVPSIAGKKRETGFSTDEASGAGPAAGGFVAQPAHRQRSAG